MKKRVLLAAFLCVICLLILPGKANAAGDVAINTANFPDFFFRDFVSSNYDTNHNGVLSPAEIAAVECMDVFDRGISSLKGIEFFTNLYDLRCYGNFLSSLDVSACTKLERLDCEKNRLTSLNVSGLTSLFWLDCTNNHLTTLNLSGCSNLVILLCSYNYLTSISVPPIVNIFDCSNNELTSLYLSTNTHLCEFICYQNNITTLDISGCSALAGDYCCIVGNQKNNRTITVTMTAAQKAGFERSMNEVYDYRNDRVVIRLPQSLRITGHPGTKTVALNSTAQFGVIASGNGLTYQWQYQMPGSTTWTNTTLTGCKTSLLSVPATAARNGCKYRCVVKDSSGKTAYSNAATLTISGVITITGHPGTKTVNAGSTAQFGVIAYGAGLKYQWQYQMPGSTTWTNTTLTGYNTSLLSVPVTAARNGCKYRCVVTCSTGATKATNPATLTVAGVLTITGHPGTKTVALNSTAQFGVIATGTGLTYQWQYQMPGSTTWTNTTLTGAKTSLLSVPATAARNACKYRCVVKDSSGKTAYSNPATMTISGVITIAGHPGTKTVAAGSTAQFGVIAYGAGLSYQWQYQLPGSSTWTNTTLTGAKTSLLSVPATAARNGCKYRCVVTCSTGATKATNPATLTVK